MVSDGGVNLHPYIKSAQLKPDVVVQDVVRAVQVEHISLTPC